jgi:hypothetical protein
MSSWFSAERKVALPYEREDSQRRHCSDLRGKTASAMKLNRYRFIKCNSTFPFGQSEPAGALQHGCMQAFPTAVRKRGGAKANGGAPGHECTNPIG